MARAFSFGKIELVASIEEAGAPAELVHETPFRIGVLGDFSGRANRGLVDGRARAGRTTAPPDRP